MTFKLPKYKCHKEVNAEPMSRGEYNTYRGWTIPEGEDPEDEGFLVVYNMGSPEQYISWSPKPIFLDGYSLI